MFLRFVTPLTALIALFIESLGKSLAMSDARSSFADYLVEPDP